jgi:uncharacterized protein YggT (Ycf19 family)
MPYVMTNNDRYVADRYPETNSSAILATIANALWYVFAIFESFLLLGLVLRFVGATAANGLIDFIYTIAGVLTAPFRGIFGSVTIGRGLLDLDMVLAMAIYWLIAKVLTSLAKPRYVVTNTTNTNRTVVNDDGTVFYDRRRRPDYQLRG